MPPSCNPFACCCCCCKCVFNCVASCILQILCTLLIIAAIMCLIIYLILKPNKVNFIITDAAVTVFDYQTTTSTLNYELALNITVENKNKRLGISYESIEASAFYEKQRFSSITMMPFFQKVENTSLIHPVFRGQSKVALGGEEAYHYFQDKNEGMYEIDVKLYLKVKFKWIWFIQTSKFSPVIDCDVKAPVYSHGEVPVTFQPKECGFDW